MNTIALAIPHTPWVPERVKSLGRLIDSIYGWDGSEHFMLMCGGDRACFRVLDERASNDVWSEHMWEWLVEQPVEWCLQLQDDTVVCEDFWPILQGLLHALPDEADIVGLQVPHTAAPALFEQGEHLFTTSDMAIGVGYVVRRDALAEFLTWRKTELRPGWRNADEKIEYEWAKNYMGQPIHPQTPRVASHEVNPHGPPHLTEDTMLGVWALATGRRVYHPNPTLIDHDVAMQSTYGNDDHHNRRSLVTMVNAPYSNAQMRLLAQSVPFWTPAGGREIPHLGRFYEATPDMALTWVKSFETSHYARAKADTGLRVKTRLAHARRASRDFQPLATALLCTPSHGSPHPKYVESVLRLMRDSALDLVEPLEGIGLDALSYDLVRTRSIHAKRVVDTGADVGIFIDDDIEVDPGAIKRMVACVMTGGRDIVCCPYPRRERILFDNIAAPDPYGRSPQARAYEYNLTLLKTNGERDMTPDADGCLEVESAPIGCAVIARRVFERVIEECGHLEWTRGVGAPCRAVFMIDVVGGALVGEDASFLMRARCCGFRVHLYLGPGSPATHWGMHGFRGDVGAFGIVRTET